MDYLFGTIIGIIIGFIIGFIFYKNRTQDKKESVKVNIGSYLTRIGELRVYRAYMKEIVTSVEHVWGDIGKKYFSWMVSEKKTCDGF